MEVEADALDSVAPFLSYWPSWDLAQVNIRIANLASKSEEKLTHPLSQSEAQAAPSHAPSQNTSSSASAS